MFAHHMPVFHSPLPRRSGKRLRQLGLAFLLALTPILAGCESDEESPAPQPPKTSLSLVGISSATAVVGARFGPDFDNPGDISTYGVEVTLSSNQGGTTYYKFDATDCTTVATHTTYSSSSKPFFQPASAIADQSWSFCYYSRANGLNESMRLVTIIFYQTAPAPTLVDTDGVDPTATGVFYESFPFFNVGFSVAYNGEGGSIHYTTDGSDPTTPNAPVANPDTGTILVTNSVGQGSFQFSGGATREVKLVVLDDVGNQGTVQTYPIRMELMTTDPSAGFFDVATGVQLTPPPEAFIDKTFSEAFIHLCRYTILGGYECAANLSTFSSAASQRAALDTDSPYTFGGEAANNEVINLPGSAGVTTVYDLKILNDSLNLDSVTDVDHQALFVIDLDVPQALVFPDPDPTTDDSMFVQATGYDAGYFTVLASSITNYALSRDLSVPCDSVSPATCFEPIASSMTVPGSALARPTDNQAVAVNVTVTDSSGNTNNINKYIPIGRSLMGGSGNNASANLGHALATGDFNTIPGTTVLDALKPPNYAIGEPSAGAGKVFLFYERMRSALDFQGSVNFSSLDLTTVPPPGNTLTLTVEVNGIPVVDTITLTDRNEYISNLAAVNPSQLAHAFNQEVLRLKAGGTDLQVYMTAESGAHPATPTHVVLRSNTGQIDTCITIAPTALATALGLSPTGTATCVYDAKITGETSGDGFGFALATGDFDGDGYDDLAVGAPNANGGTGRVYIFHSGCPPIPCTTGPAFPTGAASANVAINGGTAGDDFGWTLAAGILDTERVVGNKSSDDLAVGAPGYTVGTDADAGRVYLYRGVDGTGLNTTAFWSEANPNTSGRLGPRAGERFGHSLLVGQMNDTDTHEVAIGAPGGTSLSDSSYTGKGSVYYLEVNLLNGEEHLGRGKGQVVRPQTQHPLQVMAGIGERSISTDS